MGCTDVTILLVEDDEVDAGAVERSLRRSGLENRVVKARDGVEALERLRAAGPEGDRVTRPYLILLDLNLPRMDGVEFLGELRDDAELRDSIVFVLTTSSAETDRREAYAANVAAYVPKDRVGEHYENFVRLLETYSECVEFPPEAS